MSEADCFAQPKLPKVSANGGGAAARSAHIDVDVDVEWMYELRQSPLCPPQTYDLHSNDTIKFLVTLLHFDFRFLLTVH